MCTDFSRVYVVSDISFSYFWDEADDDEDIIILDEHFHYFVHDDTPWCKYAISSWRYFSAASWWCSYADYAIWKIIDEDADVPLMWMCSLGFEMMV